MDYQILDSESVLEYVRRRPETEGIIDPRRQLEAVEVGDGNLNLIFKVSEVENPTRTLLVKQALPHVRTAVDWKLSPTRGKFEALSLRAFHSLAPGSVPVPLWYDSEQFTIGMQNLLGYEVIREPMMRGVEIPSLGIFVGTTIARVHFGTSDFAVDSADKKAAVAPYLRNTELCRITEDLVLTEPFYPNLGRNYWTPEIDEDVADLQADDALKSDVAELKLRFVTCAQALLHGDLHTGSIMARDDAIRIIDSEFAFYGPMGFDLGMFLANLSMNAASQPGHAVSEESLRTYQDYLRRQIVETLESYRATFLGCFDGVSSLSWSAPGFAEIFLRELLQDACGFAGTEMIRRTIGFAHIKDLDLIPDKSVRAAVQSQVLSMGRRLIRVRRGVKGLDDLVTILTNSEKV